MNTRGLVELIVLNIGLSAHVISTKLFTILVLMVSTHPLPSVFWIRRVLRL